jgi:Uma2 family endonuclease
MVISDRTYTAEEFETFMLLPEHGDTLFELIEGRIYPVVSNNRSSRIGIQLGAVIVIYVKQHKLGWVTGADGGYIVAGQRYIPDVAFMSKERQPQSSDAAYNPIAPNLAVEVLSPNDDPANLRIKIVNYLRADTTVWIIDPDTTTVEIYTPDKQTAKLSKDDTLSGGDVLPGFEILVSDIFDI